VNKNQLEVMTLMNRCPRRSYSQMFYWLGGMTRGTWAYWSMRLERMGLAESEWRGRGCYAWRGYKLTELGHKILAQEIVVEIPF